MKSKYLAFSTFLLLALTAPAAVVLSGNFNTGTPTATLTITNDIVFTITVTGIARGVVFDEWTSSDGHNDLVVNTQPINVVINNVTTNITSYALHDNFASTSGSLTPNDGYLDFTSNFLAVTAGDTYTLKAGSYQFSPTPGAFNSPLNNRIFTGNAFVFRSQTEAALSGPTSVGPNVPEPSAAILGLLSVLPLLRRRRAQWA
jgi:hypothetical protein